MNNKTLFFALAAAVALGIGGYALYRFGMNRGMQMNGATAASVSPGAAQKPGDVDPTTGKKVLYWHDPMVPGQKFDKPGKSPFMDMQLVPVYADSDADAGCGRHQSSGAAEPRRTYRRSQVRRANVDAWRLSAALRTTSATWRSCKREATAFWNDSTYVRRSTRCAKDSPWPSSTCPIGLPPRKTTCRPSASMQGPTRQLVRGLPTPPSKGCGSRA